MGTVNGPGSSVVGNVVLWNDTTGTTVSDSGETLSLQGLSNVTYQTGGSPSNLIIGQQVTLASGAKSNVFVGELSGATAANSTSTTSYNTAVGYGAMAFLTSGYGNIALGTSAMQNITTGVDNIAIGQNALVRIAAGAANVGIGSGVLGYATGDDNTAIGDSVLSFVTTGSANVGVGGNVGATLTTGSYNILMGYGADVPNLGTTSNFMNIGGLIFGTGMTGSAISPAGSVGIGISLPVNTLCVSPLQYDIGTASQSGTTITGTGGQAWTSAMVGSQFNFNNGVSAGIITAVGSATSLTVTTSQTVFNSYTINYVGLQVTSTGKVGIGTTSPIVSLDLSQNTDALALPVGTTAQRPTGANGEIRYNSTNSAIEAYIGGAWTSLGASSVSGDAFWHQVSFMPRAATGNTGSDLSGNAIALTVTNAATSTTQTKYDPYSWSFNGTSNVVYAASNAQAAFGTGDFTVEVWFYATAANNFAALAGMTTTGATSWALQFSGTTTTPIWAHSATATLITGSSSLGLNGWHHVAIVRRNGVATLYGDGLIQGTATDTTNYAAGQVGIGYISAAASGYFQGYISGLRVTEFARYLTPFTPPAAQFPSTLLGGP